MSKQFEELKALVDFSKIGLNPITENYYLCECPQCGWVGSSSDINGGPDDEACYCHVCQDFTEVDEVATGTEAFNKLLPCITALLAALEEKDQALELEREKSRRVMSENHHQALRIEELEKNQRTAWDRCLDAEHTKMQALLTQAERRTKAAEQRLQQPIKLPRVAAIYASLSDVGRHRTSAENVRDVMDAIQAHAANKVEGE